MQPNKTMNSIGTDAAREPEIKAQEYLAYFTSLANICTGGTSLQELHCNFRMPVHACQVQEYHPPLTVAFNHLSQLFWRTALCFSCLSLTVHPQGFFYSKF